MTESRPEGSATSMALTAWMEILDEHLAAERFPAASTVLRGLLAQRPTHLDAYERALELTWQLRQFRECRSMAMRLLRADPLNLSAYCVLARLQEMEEHATGEDARWLWQRAWQMHPLHAELRGRWLKVNGDLELDRPALGFIHMHSRHWIEATREFGRLAERSPARTDWRVASLISLWRSYRRAEARTMARALVDGNRHLLAGWLILDLVGDEVDQTIAQTYIHRLDPEGTYTERMLGFGFVPAGSAVPQLEVPETNPMLMHCLYLREWSPG